MDKIISKTPQQSKVKTMVMVAMFAALLTVLSQIAIPMPSGVPVTLQTFAIALTGVILGYKLATESVAVYILLGAVGLPVFSNFNSGLSAILGYTGGFIWGFLALAFLCGVGSANKNKMIGFLFGLVGLLICHLLGILQFSVLMKMDVIKSMLLVSVPYLIKDVISIVLAFILGGQIRKRLIKANIF